jgi:hypothetical protein
MKGENSWSGLSVKQKVSQIFLQGLKSALDKGSSPDPSAGSTKSASELLDNISFLML